MEFVFQNLKWQRYKKNCKKWDSKNRYFYLTTSFFCTTVPSPATIRTTYTPSRSPLRGISSRSAATDGNDKHLRPSTS